MKIIKIEKKFKSTLSGFSGRYHRDFVPLLFTALNKSYVLRLDDDYHP